MGTPYIEMLSNELQKLHWSLCQLHMRSSYLGFGTGSLGRDFEDMSACVSYLQNRGKKRIVLMGHSTGAQNSIYYALHQLSNKDTPSISAVIVLI